MGIGRYIATRALLAIPMLLVLLSVVFLILRVMPGDPVLAVLGGRNVSPELIEKYRVRLGLDRPIVVQYIEYVADVCRGNFGVSIRTNEPVIAELIRRFPATFELTLFGTLWAVAIGMFSGIFSARRVDRPVDHAVRAFHIASFAMPIFWTGLILQIIFAVNLRIMPVGGRLDPVASAFFRPITNVYFIDAILRRDMHLLVDALRHVALPSFTLGLVLSGAIGRMTRTSMLEVLSSDYIRTARAKGLGENTVVYRHGLKNALIPIVTVMGLQVAILMGGAILTETVYSWPGIARYMLVSIDARDFPAIQGTVVFIAIFISLVNLVVDVIYSQLDPRVRY